MTGLITARMAGKFGALIYCLECWIRLSRSNITAEVERCGIVAIKRDSCTVICLTWDEWLEFQEEWPRNSIGRVFALQAKS